MSFDIAQLRATIARHGPVMRVVVAAVEGSAPRETGASMLVWKGGQSGTIGGGALEFEAADWARTGRFTRRVPLGPAMGQCCGGAVTLVAEEFTSADLDTIDGYHMRRIEGSADIPLALHRAVSEFRNSGKPVFPCLVNGWFLEPVTTPARALWIYGAGHVGRALVNVLSPLPDIDITWVDTGPDRFPDNMPANVAPLVATNPADAVRHAPAHAEHLVLTYSHAFDLEICHAVLSHGFRRAGLIGSATKWARFRKRLMALGHGPEHINRIDCPIGNPAFGKHPQAIAVSVAADLLSAESAKMRELGETG